MLKKPELLAPAGDEERLEAALLYGADAVYLGGRRFGMRAGPENFSPDGLRRAVALAHQKGVKVYLTCNTLPRQGELAAQMCIRDRPGAGGADRPPRRGRGRQYLSDRRPGLPQGVRPGAGAAHHPHGGRHPAGDRL